MDENNIIVRVTGEANLSAAQQEMQDLASSAYDIAQALTDLRKAEAAEIAELEKQRKEIEDNIASLQELIDTQENAQSVVEQLNEQIAEEQSKLAGLGKQIDSVRAKYKPLIMEKQSELRANKQNAAELSKSINQYKMIGGAAGTMRNQIRELTMRLQEMEAAGDTSSQTYMDMSVQLAKLTDAAGDTQAAIRLLASDTKNLDVAMQVGSGLAGAFNATTSAMALFDGESEELQKAFLKVQAAMAMLNGVQQVAAVLDKRSAANIVLRTALTKLFAKEKAKETRNVVAATTASGADAVAKGTETAATTAATVATKAWTAALLANPIMWLVLGISALVAGIALYNSSISKSGKAERAAEKSQKALEHQTLLTTKQFQRYGAAHEKVMTDIEKRETHEMANAKKRNATNLEMHNIELGYMKERRDELNAYQKKFIAQNNIEQKAANKAVEDQRKVVNSKKKGTKEYYEAVEKLNELEQHMNETYAAGTEAYMDYYNAFYAVVEKEAEIAAERLAIADKLKQSRLNLMKDGAEKEIAQVKFNYEQQLREVEKGSALYQSMIAERDKAIEDINRQYDLRIQAAVVKQYKNESDAAEHDLELKKWYYEQDAQYKVMALDKNKMTEEEYAAAVEEINIGLQKNLRSIESERINSETALRNDALIAQQNYAEEVLSSSKTTYAEALQAQRDLKDARDQLLQSEFDALDAHYKNGEMTYEEYQRKLEELNHERIQNEIDDENQKFEQIKELSSEIMSFVGDMASEIFGAISDNINRQLEDLDNLYTTDAEEAKENANKKYISEKELEDKKLELKRKAAAVEKAEAAFNIAMNTAMAIMRIWADVPKVDFGATTIVMTAMAAALGATQLAMVLAKPLPQYAKGRAGGEGEFAMVGERGAELMYIPQGASIVPHDKLSRPELWGQYGIPKGKRPIMPHVDPDIAGFAIAQQMGYGIDYDKLGRTIMDNVRIPAQKAVHVNVDRTGILVSEGNDTHHILNHKYEAAWT